MGRIDIMNIQIDNVSMSEAIDKIDTMVNEKHFKMVVTPNVDHIIKLQSDCEFKEVYDNSDLILTDGKILVWSAKLLGKKVKEKVSGSDLFPVLCKHASEKNYKVFFLGGNEGVARKAAETLINKYPNLNVVGTYSPPYGFEKSEEENNKIINMLLNKEPHILFVGLGAPKQEKWIYKFKDKYKVPVSLGIGASFDFIAGTVKRAPEWMQNCGLEWFYRFLCEPKRLFKRYFIDDSKFLVLLIKEFFRGGKIKND